MDIGGSSLSQSGVFFPSSASPHPSKGLGLFGLARASSLVQLHVGAKVILATKGAAAFLAQVLLDARVARHVARELVAAGEAPVAVLAAVGALARVRPHVGLEMRALGVRLGAFGAGKWPILAVGLAVVVAIFLVLAAADAARAAFGAAASRAAGR